MPTVNQTKDLLEEQGGVRCTCTGGRLPPEYRSSRQEQPRSTRGSSNIAFRQSPWRTEQQRRQGTVLQASTNQPRRCNRGSKGTRIVSARRTAAAPGDQPSTCCQAPASPLTASEVPKSWGRTERPRRQRQVAIPVSCAVRPHGTAQGWKKG